MGFERWFNRTLNQVWGFIEDRTGMPKWALRPQPEFTFKPSYWTGAFVANALIFQIITGMLLLLYYQPSVNPTYTACGQPVGPSRRPRRRGAARTTSSIPSRWVSSCCRPTCTAPTR